MLSSQPTKNIAQNRIRDGRVAPTIEPMGSSPRLHGHLSCMNVWTLLRGSVTESKLSSLQPFLKIPFHIYATSISSCLLGNQMWKPARLRKQFGCALPFMTPAVTHKAARLLHVHADNSLTTLLRKRGQPASLTQ